MHAQLLRPNPTTVALALVGLFCATPAYAQLSPNMQDMLRRIHTTQEFGGGGRGAGASGRWVDKGQGYTATERTPEGGTEIVRYDTATGTRSVLMIAAQLMPPELGKPLQFSEYSASADGTRMLFATNGRPTMIRKTAYEYWTLDKTSNTWRKLGGNAAGPTAGLKTRPPRTEDTTRPPRTEDTTRPPGVCFMRDSRPTARAPPTCATTTSTWRTSAPARSRR